MQNQSKLVRPAQVCEMLSISRPTLYRLIKNPDFPQPFPLGKRAVAFDKGEIKQFIEDRKQQRGEQ